MENLSASTSGGKSWEQDQAKVARKLRGGGGWRRLLGLDRLRDLGAQGLSGTERDSGTHASGRAA